jgi:hypothetical protein
LVGAAAEKLLHDAGGEDAEKSEDEAEDESVGDDGAGEDAIVGHEKSLPERGLEEIGEAA